MSDQQAMPSTGSHVIGASRQPRSSGLPAALADIREGLRQWPLWFTLGNFEIRLRFRRTLLGPLWNTLSFAVLVAALGTVYGRVLQEDVRTYLPYLALGLFSWVFIAATVQEACIAFVDASAVLTQLYVPRSVVVYRTLWRNLVLLGFNAGVVVVVLIVCGTPVRAATMPLALAGLTLLTFNLAWIALALAVAGARLRLVGRLVQTALPIAMLATPVIWRPSGEALRRVAEWNPLYWAIELVRAPLLGEPVSVLAWAVAIAVALMGGGATLVAFSLARPRITYWL